MSRFLVALLFIFSFNVHAQTAQKKSTGGRITLDSSNTVRVNYGYKAWNKSSTQIDTASLIMREGASGRVVQVQLTETEPDSSIFSGLYSINWRNIDQLQVEFYVAPQELLTNESGLKKLTAMISSEQLKRKPFILRRTLSGQQNVEIFDTKEQARSAIKAYRAEQQLALQNQRATKIPSDQDLETAQLAEDRRLQEAAAVQEANRLRLEQLEAQRIEQLRAQQASLAAAEKEANRKRAAALGIEGVEAFKQENFELAKKKFDQAVELDPENRLFYFQYGVSLYKTEDFNRSLVILNLADGPGVNATEKSFFLALNHFRMRDFQKARADFKKVAASKDPVMAPAAHFYEGVTFFDERNWDSALPSFQAVLDTSKDAALDARAESYIEQILRIRQYEEAAKQKWNLTATFGEIYDSNVLLISDSQRDSGVATDTAGLRTLFSGNLRYRPIYEETREFAAQLDLITMLTLDEKFQSDDDLRNADPTVATLLLPYTIKSTLFNRGYKLDIAPGYETTYMSIEDNSNKEILSSILLNVSNLLVMSDTWFSNYNAEIRMDESKLRSSTGDDDASALKVKLLMNHMFFVTDDKSRIVLAEGAYTTNQAKGKNLVYDRIDVGVGYIRPWLWDTSVNFKLGYFLLSFPQADRTDNSLTLTAGLSKKLSDVWSTGFLASYNTNQSTQDVNKFNKFTALLTLSAAVGF